MKFEIVYGAEVPSGCTDVLIPGGLTTPESGCAQVDVSGGAVTEMTEATTGQRVLVARPDQDEITVTYRFDTALAARYPDVMFAPRPSRFTRFADALAAEAHEAAGGRTGLASATAIACATARRFTYGHPQARFHDGLDQIPALGCGLTEGSCVDINMYFIAALRAAGIEAGYVTGYFFPAEKRDWCDDGHCWVVTRIDGVCAAWDIAHHLKLGTHDIRPGLNPKPGFRAATFHSMGLAMPELGLVEHKALIEPVAMVAGAACSFAKPRISLRHPGLATA